MFHEVLHDGVLDAGRDSPCPHQQGERGRQRQGRRPATKLAVGQPGLQPPYRHDFHGAWAKPPYHHEDEEEGKKGLEEEEEEASPPNVISSFVPDA